MAWVPYPKAARGILAIHAVWRPHNVKLSGDWKCMKHLPLLLATLLVVCLAPLASPARAQGFVHADHRQIMDAQGNPLILRGLNLGGWMVQEGYMMGLSNLKAQHVIRSRISQIIGKEKTETFYQSWRDNAVTRADIDAMAKWGFNSVRLPMHWNLFIKDTPDKTATGQIIWNEEGFRRVDALIAWLKANDMVLILDLHAAPGGQVTASGRSCPAGRSTDPGRPA